MSEVGTSDLVSCDFTVFVLLVTILVMTAVVFTQNV